MQKESPKSFGFDQSISLAWRPSHQFRVRLSDEVLAFWRTSQHHPRYFTIYSEHLGPVYTMTTNKDSLYTAGSEGVLRHWDLSSLAKGKIVCLQEK
jgi:hypothetical protein